MAVVPAPAWYTTRPNRTPEALAAAKAAAAEQCDELAVVLARLATQLHVVPGNLAHPHAPDLHDAGADIARGLRTLAQLAGRRDDPALCSLLAEFGADER